MARRIPNDPRRASDYGVSCLIELRSKSDGTISLTNLTYDTVDTFKTFADLHNAMVGYQRRGDIIVFVD